MSDWHHPPSDGLAGGSSGMSHRIAMLDSVD
jgi:hypothetical protein